MEVKLIDTDCASVVASRDELLTLRHCVLEALTALDNADEFKIRVGAPREDAEALLAKLEEITSSGFWGSLP